ncbi:glycolate oxidase subunit GlcE [Nitrosomonas marina]|uniref:Glycolate oxidase FAD binding subunit n=1 Tax=Nitrosomonas marina TaxID=917 RepID=A0A1H8CTQ6_9PROT|nr:glycolate oxidase subunit GlcE [Nitrosomonas marina]SEM98360.1 glycolate oxidase FAD binding subunit [Nitrosomonas marina]
MQQTLVDQFSETVRTAAKVRQPLHIRGGNSKSFYGYPPSEQSQVLDISTYQGVTDYEPTELVITARAGTRISDIESLLHQHNQMLAFEPPYFADTATIGGCIAAGLSGPRRASAGAVRDFVLGVRILDGTGRDLHFGGQVMKNVAGYDVSRLMVGAMGTLGVLLEVSLKVLPLPAVEQTISLKMNEMEAIEFMNRWAGKPLPISATSYVNGQLYMRLSGAESAVRAAHMQLGGEIFPAGNTLWKSIREHTYDFFKPSIPLWRLSVKSTTPPISFPQTKQLIEWNGALRWLSCQKVPAVDSIRQAAIKYGGHATLFRGYCSTAPIFQPLSPALASIHRQLKQQFDPAGILNTGRLYPEI